MQARATDAPYFAAACAGGVRTESQASVADSEAAIVRGARLSGTVPKGAVSEECGGLDS